MWPGFDELDVTAVISPTLGSNSVYFVHSDNNKYQMYDFTDILKPVKVRSGNADIQMGTTILTFMDNYMNSVPSVPIKTVIDVSVGLSYTKSLILLSKESYCAYNLGEASSTRGVSYHSIDFMLSIDLSFN